MSKQTVAEQQSAVDSVAILNPMSVLKGLEVVSVAELAAKLRELKIEEPAKTIRGMMDDGLLRPLGNTSLDKKKNRRGYRFKVTLPPEGGAFWARMLPGYGPAVRVDGVGTLDAVGRRVELSGATVAKLRDPSVPVELISDAATVAKLEAEADKKAAARAAVVDKGAAMLAEIDAA